MRKRLKDRAGTNMMRLWAPGGPGTPYRARNQPEETPMLERALPIRHSPVADAPAIDARARLREWRDRLLWLLRILGDFIAKGGPLS